MKLIGKTVGVLVGPLFEDLEFWAVVMRVREEGAKVVVIGTVAGETHTSKSGGLTARAEVASAEVSSRDLDALLVPGGFAPDKMRRDPDMLRLVRELNQQGKVLGFICHAGWVDAPAFRDGNLVWGRVVDDIPAYNRELIAALAEAE